MGRQNEMIPGGDDTQFDTDLLAVLSRVGEPRPATPPPDLVTRALRRLPRELPAMVEARTARQARIRQVKYISGFSALAGMFVLGLWSLYTGGPQLQWLAASSPVLTNTIGRFARVPGYLLEGSYPERILFSVIFGVVLLGFSVLCIGMWPRRTAVTGIALARFPIRATVLGLAFTIAAGLLIPPLIVVLAASLIGLPLALVVGFVAHVPYIYGLMALVRAMRVSNALFGVPDVITSATIGGMGIGIALIGYLVPIWAIGLFYLLAIPGVGAAILSNGGMRIPAV